MSFWQVTMKRSVKLSKTYFGLGAMMSVYGVVLSNIFPIISSLPTNATPAPVDLSSTFPILSVALLSLSAVFFSLPVIMLFVYDKNNGVLEYVLSTGFNQMDIFKGYVKASLTLASVLLIFAVVLNTVVGLVVGTSLGVLASIAVLTFAIGVSEVFLVSVCMISFSSFQKTPMGANQPLGVVVGVIPMFPSLLLPIVFPLYAVYIDLAVAASVAIAALTLLFSVSRLIQREKLLP